MCTFPAVYIAFVNVITISPVCGSVTKVTLTNKRSLINSLSCEYVDTLMMVRCLPSVSTQSALSGQISPVRVLSNKHSLMSLHDVPSPHQGLNCSADYQLIDYAFSVPTFISIEAIAFKIWFSINTICIFITVMSLIHTFIFIGTKTSCSIKTRITFTIKATFGIYTDVIRFKRLTN